MHKTNPLLWASLLALPWTLFAQNGLDGMSLEYHGAGWVQLGEIEHSYAGITPNNNDNNANKNWLQNGGGQIGVVAKIDSNWEGGFGLGVIAIHASRGSEGVALNWYPFWVPYVSEARITYTHRAFTQDGKFQFTLGAFPYNYSPDAKNLGLYLMQGYVYPGALESGFGGIYGGADPTEFGGMARYEQGGFRNDLILKSETERPDYDWSLIDIISYKLRPGLEIGGGVNFYRLIPNNSALTSPGASCEGLSYGQCFIVDSSVITSSHPNPDTLTGSLAGTKLMARFHLDPKILFGLSSLGSLTLGEKDLILYGEGAIIGLKNYPVYYDDIWRRIPVMIGFNFPAFGYLDYLSAEVEYYGSRNSSDNTGASFGGAWVPLAGNEDPDLAHYDMRDHWKWSVNVARTFFGHMQASAQVADDHLRLGGTHDLPWFGQEALRTPEDWYWMCKLAFFF